MGFFRQAILGLVVVGCTVLLWALYVPAAAPVLERVGVYAALGITPPAEAASDGARRGGGATRVAVEETVTGRINTQVEAIGDARAIRSVTVRPEEPGTIRTLAVASGAYVTEGALIAQLDDEAERIALERAQLMLDEATADLARLRQLESSGAVTAVQLRETELERRAAALALRQAELDVNRRRVTAPIDGWVGLIGVEQGDRITSQDAIAVITDRAQIQIEFRIPERHVAQLDIGTPIDVAPLADRDRVIRGEIVALDNQIDRASRTLRVQGRIDNSEDRLRDGQAFAVTLSFTGDELPGVNPLAVQWSSEGSFVWVVRDDTATRMPVTIRQRSRDMVLVEGDLAPGDIVVTEGVQSLRDGATVEIVTDAAGQADTTAAAERGRAI
jgi:RND family efflux transporter MFP subunit